MTDPMEDLERRVRALEDRLAEAESEGGAGASSSGPALPPGSEDSFWALVGLEERVGPSGAVMLVGSVEVPGSGRAKWQYGLDTETLADRDWASAVPALDALAHPVRLALLKLVFGGVHTTAELTTAAGLGTTGQLHHHLRALISGGWLHTTARGRYEIPADRIVPLLAILTATTT
ncbi:ArsR/SmtB family transcription factor [Microlunatus sp. Y2014]|uniref:ArsR/SmtB family transcription factor n=1 Tax=Microlunatus sp. Y2014 TaxID=3418488 RepID=UPI003DA6D27B